MRLARKRLAQNPNDPEGLLSLADLYYEEEEFEKARRSYQALISLCASHPDLDEYTINLKASLAALKLGMLDEAYKGLVIAKSMRSQDFEVNHNLGYLEYLRKNYDRSVVLLKNAIAPQPEHLPSVRFLGHSLFRLKRCKEATEALSQVVENMPDDKDSCFLLARCYYELGSTDKALRIFTQQRTDPKLGPSAALFCGTINMNNRQVSQAILDFEIGLRHADIKKVIRLELKYRLATAHAKTQEMNRALALLREIQGEERDYKDVAQLKETYRELAKNRSLQIYLVAPLSEFVTLCRKIATKYHSQASTKLIDISIVKNEYVDILAEVSSKSWESLVLFRFVRTSGDVGELIVRELYTRSRDLKASRAVCLVAGSFTEGAVQYVEARLIDLVDRKALVALFDRLSLSALSPR
jgi:tetratricopeptide (TPR) repeat protein